MSDYVITYDVGTTGMKTCLYRIANRIELVASDVACYHLTISKGGGAEQSPEDLWLAMCLTSQSVIQKSHVNQEEIKGISFCAQMQGLVLVDKLGEPVRPIMSYMDQRASKEMQEGIAKGVKISGLNANKLMQSLRITGAVAASVKDPVWKYNWVKNNEPDLFERVYKWLDVKEYLILKCTGEFVMTHDSAFGTMLFDIRKQKQCFSKTMCKLLGVHYDHMPRIVNSTDCVGTLTPEACSALGLSEKTCVFGGGGDASLIGVGAGAVSLGQTHIYSGTSGWVSTVVAKRTVDMGAMIASIVGADSDKYNYFAELETASKCLEWVKDHLALDEINIYLNKVSVSDSVDTLYENLFDFMMDEISKVPAGSHGVIFTPWLHGNRCPFEDPYARGMFFNISIDTGKRDMIHAVLEGICYHLRWQLEAQDKKIRTSHVVRFVGGGALSVLMCQILADVIGRPVETVEDPQNVGALGAAILVAVGLGKIKNIEEAKDLVLPNHLYLPNRENSAIHQKHFETFKRLYKQNRKNFTAINVG